MANTLKELFGQAIQEGMASAKKITENAPRAMAYAALADAIVKTGLVSPSSSETSTTEVDQPKGKSALASATSKKASAPSSAPIEEPAEEPTEEAPEVELSEDWTEETIELKSEQIAFIEQLKEDYEESTLDNCMVQFSEGNIEKLSEVTPLNIDAFVSFMQQMIAAQEA